MRSPRLALFLLALTTAALRSQCPPIWQAGPGFSGTNGLVFASTTWDPDGPGPAAPVLVVGGDFQMAGAVFAERIAAWSPATSTWSAIGGGLGGRVLALAALPTGELIAAGSFESAGGAPAARIARWNGMTWSPLGSGMDHDVRALAVMPNGDLMAGGTFTIAGGTPAAGVARWDGSTWSPLGGGLPPGTSALALLALPNGDLLVGGDFTTAGGIPANRVARWDGSSWSPLGSGADAAVNALLRLPSGDVIAGGAGTFGGVANRVGRWNGSAWSALGSGLFPPVRSLLALPSGELLAGMGSNSGSGIASWNGTTWSYDNTGPATIVHTLAVLPNGDPVAGGSFTLNNLLYLARRTAAGWTGLAPGGFSDSVWTLLPLQDGSIVAGGRFTRVGGVPANHIARLVGGSWQALGSGMNNGVQALLQLPNGDLLAGGFFSLAGNLPAMGLARWNGSTWSVFGGLAGGQTFLPMVNVMRRRSNGDVVIGGSFTSIGGVAANNIARWNGSGFFPFGQGLVGVVSIAPGSVDALAELPNGDLVAGGRFSEVNGGPAIGGKVARWNGSTWTVLAGLPGDRAQALLVRGNGDLVASVSPSAALHRWTGSAWAALPASPTGSASAMLNLPDGDLLVGGQFVPFAASNMMRWNGTTWTDFGGPNWTVRALASTPSGDVLVGGLFTTINGQVAPYFGRVGSSCPATTTAAGAGCSGSGGEMVLAATSLPWLGGTARARATGLPSASLALGVRGFNLGSAPLALPNAGPGCLLFASPDLLDVYLPVGGVVDTALAIPDTAALIGVVVHEQMVGIRLAATGLVAESVSSNALSLTLGDF